MDCPQVLAFHDIDDNKIGKEYSDYDEVNRRVRRTVPIRHFRDIQAHRTTHTRITSLTAAAVHHMRVAGPHGRRL